MDRSCPHCGKPLPDGASFCPYCAHGLNRRQPLEPPRYVGGQLRRAARVLGLLILGAALLLGLSNALGPKMYTGQGGLTYTDRDGVYELVLGDNGDRFAPVAEYRVWTPLDEEHARFTNLFINEAMTGGDVTELFIQTKVSSWHVEVVPDTPMDHGVTCGEPQLVAVSGMGTAFQCNPRWTGRSPDVTIRWTLNLKNGDTLCLDQRQIVEPLELRRYTAEDLPMDTMQQLQTSIDRLAEELPPDVTPELCLPPVEYEGTLILSGLPVRLYGSEVDGQRTTIRGGIRVTGRGYNATRLCDIAFAGPGIGLWAAAPLKVSGCSFRGYETAVTCRGSDWIELYDCLLTENDVGLSLAPEMGNNMVERCRFTNNGTGVLLSGETSKALVQVINCVLEQNGVNLDNRGGFALTLTDTAVS
ncbi:right-handed parallel beta-helix repeat-containing protein [Candidatus Avoscillospira sp. LCP25S3_F1]|uniref:right-handed parallel beta-helix repeat-containing protein n=1 Tax=Candidatus Avoscillospira sp. LCP25S3_F1 TaxID=3438825 RepID=UPI003F8F2C07